MFVWFGKGGGSDGAVGMTLGQRGSRENGCSLPLLFPWLFLNRRLGHRGFRSYAHGNVDGLVGTIGYVGQNLHVSGQAWRLLQSSFPLDCAVEVAGCNKVINSGHTA